MSINPLAQVKNYSSMLNRIFLCTAISASVATAILRAHWKWLDELLKPLDIPIELIGLKDQKWFGYIVPGVAFAFIARTIRLHDRLSDLLWIRAIFDVHHILLPLAQESGFPVGKLKMKTLYAQRNALMGDAFYKFVSSTNPKIDKHLIYEALDWWSWY
jgi:hypothetical protein